MDDLYREVILDHYRNPHHAGVIEAPDIEHQEHNPLCGDDITVQGKLHEETLSEVLFQGTGCAISQAGVSLLLDEVAGKPLAEIRKMTPDDAIALLGVPITPARWKCATLGLKALQSALAKAQDAASGQ